MSKNNKITQEELLSIVKYDPITGLFTALTKRRCSKNNIGDVLGTDDGKGYLQLRYNGRNYKLHRLAFLYMTGSWPVGKVDHKDRNKTNNAWINLRDATSLQNTQNTKLYANNTSGFKGVGYSTTFKKYYARIRVNGKLVHLGWFVNIEDAANAYDEGALKYFGEYAATNAMLRER